MFDNLYSALTNDGVLTDSIDKFKSSFQDEAYRRKVFDYITKQGYYNLDFDRFESGYYSKDDIVEEEEPKEVYIDFDENGFANVEKTDDPSQVYNNFEKIDRSINFDNDPFLRKAVLDEYFYVSKFDATKIPGVKIISGPTGAGADPSSYTFEQYLDAEKNHAKIELGEDKYNLFLKYKEQGDLNLEDIPENLKPSFQRTINSEKTKRNKIVLEEYTRKQGKAADERYEYIQAGLVNEEELNFYSNDYIEDYTKLADEVKKSQPLIISAGAFSSADYTKKEEAIKELLSFQSEFLEANVKKIEKDIDDYNKTLSKYNIKDDKDLNLFLKNTNVSLKTRQNIVDQNNNILNSVAKYKKRAIKFNSKSAALDALSKNYSFGYRANLALEKAVIGEIGLLVTGTLNTVTGNDIPLVRDLYNAHIDYNESLEQKQESTLPVTLSIKDGNWDNAGTIIGQQIGNNIFSITGGLGYGTAVKALAKKYVKAGLTKQLALKKAQKVTKNTIGGSFFGVEGGGKLSRIEIGQKNAQTNIDYYQNLLETQGGLTQDERDNYNKIIADSQDFLNINFGEKAFLALTYGTIAMYAERLGTMRWIDDLQKMRPLLPDLKSTMRLGSNFLIKNPAIEQIEEVSTQIGHNLMDNIVLKENKSLIDGVDADFFASTYITTLAIGGPGVASNARNIFRSAVQTRKETKKFENLTVEYIDNQDILDNGIGDLRSSDARQLKKRQTEILEELALHDTKVLNKISNLTAQEVKNVFDIELKQRKLYQQAQQLAASDANVESLNKKRKQLIKQYSDLQDQKDQIVEKPEKDLLEEASKQSLETGTQRINLQVSVSKYLFNNANVKGMGGDVNVLKSEQEVEDFFNAEVEAGNITREAANKGIQSYKLTNKDTGTVGAFGTYVKNKLVIFEENVLFGLQSSDDVIRSEAEEVAIHEYQHRFDEDTGLVKDGKVVSSHKKFVTEIIAHMKQLYKNNNISEKNYKEFLSRVNQYKTKINKNNVVNQAELLTLIGTMKRAGIINKESFSVNYAIKSLINKFKSFKNKDAFHLMNIKSVDDVLRYIDRFNEKVKSGVGVQLPDDEETQEKVEFSKGFVGLDPDLLVSIIKTTDNKAQQAAAYEELLNQFDLIALKALRYDTRKGDIPRENVLSAAREFLPGIVQRFDPNTAKFSTFVTSNIAPKAQQIYEGSKNLVSSDVSIDAPEARQVEDKTTEQATSEIKTRPKTNILKDFMLVEENKVKSVVKVNKGDTFKQVISNNAGNVGEVVFDIPSNKVMKGGDNLTGVTKYKKGMPIPSEAQNIQKFFSAGRNAELFIKTLPITNVTSKTADIDKIGENVPVSRNVYGLAIGLKGLPLDYFYEDFIDPTGEITSPSGRSKGLSSQPPVKKLKQQFLNPTKEVIDQFKLDLGITPRGQENVFDRDIGQLLKGMARVYSINASLSAAQRILELQPKTEETKQQIADITTAQSKLAYSAGENISIADFISKQRNAKVVYTSMNTGTMAQRKKAVDTYVNDIVNKLQPLFKDYQGLIGVSMLVQNNIISDKSLRDYARAEIRKKAPFFTKRSKGNIYSKKKLTSSVVNNSTDQQLLDLNSKNVKNFTLMWKIINKGLQNDPTLASVLFHFFDVSQNEGAHLQRLGAELIYIDRAIKSYYFEHALQNVNTYQFLLRAAATQNENDFNETLESLKKNYKLIAISSKDNKKIDKAGFKNVMSLDGSWNVFTSNWWERYFNKFVAQIDGGINPESLIAVGEKISLAEKLGINAKGEPRHVRLDAETGNNISEAAQNARPIQKYANFSRGMSTFDFDETLIIEGKNFIEATKDGETIKISSAQWPIQGPELQAQGYKFNFDDFVNVRGGIDGPLLQKMRNQIEKFGSSNVFVLTARPQQSATAIHGWLKSKNINIPLKNITGLGNSTGEAKALWMAEKFAEGYNDMYFVDDALPNVEAVKNVLEQLDVKSKVVQAKLNFSQGMSVDFNKIIEDVKGIDANKRFSAVKAKRRGAGKGRFRFFIPPSHEDFLGLLYNFMGKGEAGNRHREFFEKTLLKPLNRAYRELNAAKQAIASDYRSLIKKYPDLRKLINKKTPDGDFYYSDAIRVYLWDKFGFNIPNTSKADQKQLVDLVKSDKDLKAFADGVGKISRVKEGYVEPTENWEGGDIKTDLADATNRVGRKKYFAEFIENTGEIFSKENLNKIEAAYGNSVREAIEDSLYSIINGTNRPTGNNKMVNAFLDYLNGSVGATMFVNIRSAVLQQLSFVNFINFADNNIFKAAAAFANQKQFWSDYVTLFNSDMLKQRRAGAAFDLNANEITKVVGKAKTVTDKVRAVIKYLLQKGFLPTQIADSNAIALGGASFYRNRINTYVKQGMSQAEAQKKAFDDFQELAESTQQSARPDKLSMQQRSALGRLILAFQNVTSQYARLTKKAGQDLINRRKSPPYKNQAQSDMANLSRIVYYGAAQSIVFYSLQTALFAAMFEEDDEEDEEKTKRFFDRKKDRVVSGVIDSFLRGTGVGGAVISTIKNIADKYTQNKEKSQFIKSKDPAWMQVLSLSPPIDIKIRKLKYGERDFVEKGDVMRHMKTFDIDNPVWSATTNIIEGATNAPVNRLYEKTMNVREALDADNSFWQRLFMWAGWSRWNFGIENEEIEVAKEEVKAVNKKLQKKTNRSRRGRRGGR